MSSLIIQGPATVNGSIVPGGNKNAALPLIAATILTKETVVIRNVPDIVDVRNMLVILESLNVKVNFLDGVITVNAADLNSATITDALSHLTRTSILFAGPLAVRMGSAILGCPGGDIIGRRRLDTHFYGLQKLGINVKSTGSRYLFSIPKKLAGSDMFLDEASVTATEHIMTAAVLVPGHTTIRNAACEPHIAQLADLLNAMGAKISGAGTNIISIDGVSSLHAAEITVEADYVEAVSYMTLCAACGGHLEITGEIYPHNYWMARRVFERFGSNFYLTQGQIVIDAPNQLKVIPDFNNAIPCISDGPWPQFPSDMMSCMIALATQASGTVLFFEKMFESRLYFVDKLIAMGANAIVCDPHRVVISGPAKLHGIEMTSPDIRAGMAMVVAACCAKGQSIIHNIDMVKRGYADLTKKLLSLGINCREE